MRHIILILLLACCYVKGVNAQWQQVQSLTGGSIISDFEEFKGNLYISVVNAGVFRSTDQGDNWERLNVPTQPNIVQLVEHDAELLALSYGRVFRTSDGITWVENRGVEGFINDVSSDGTALFVAAFDGIYKSGDAGFSWTKAADVSTHIDIKSVVVNGSRVLAGAEIQEKGIIFKSEDGGSTWSKINHGSNFISSIFINGGLIFINIPYDGAYKSSDNGLTWKLIRANPHGEANLYVTTTSLYFFSNFRLSVSNDNGDSWSERNGTIPSFSTSELFVNDQYAFVGCWGGGIFRTDKSATGLWQEKNSGLAVGDINDIEILNDRLFAAMEFSFIRSSADGGVTWDQKRDAFNTPSGGSRVLMSTESALFVGQGGGGIQRSSDAGNTWQRKNEGLENWNVIGFASIGDQIYAATDDDVYTSENGGEHWERTVTDITSGVRTVYSDGQKLYTGTWQGLFVSENRGASSKKISAGLPDESIGHVAHLGSVLFVATQFNGLFRSKDTGSTWELANSNSVRSLAVRGTDVLMGSFPGKVYVSADSGETWKDVSAGLPDVAISTIAYSDTHLFVGTSSGFGLWQRPLIEIFAPRIAVATGYPGSRFRIGQPIQITSDQELTGSAGAVLQAGELPDYITLKNSAGDHLAYSAEISADRRTITLLPEDVVDGELYTLTIQPIFNAAGLQSKLNEIELTAFINTLPIVYTVSVNAMQDQVFTFTTESFSESFSDADNDALVKILVTSPPEHGSLQVDNVNLQVSSEINVESIPRMTYTPTKGYVGTDQWRWKGADNSGYASQEAIVTVMVGPVTSAINEMENGTVRVFPNPAMNTINLALPGMTREDCKVSIRDLSGRIMADVPVLKAPGDSIVQIDVSFLPPGVYLLSTTVPENSFKVKLIKK